MFVRVRLGVCARPVCVVWVGMCAVCVCARESRTRWGAPNSFWCGPSMRVRACASCKQRRLRAALPRRIVLRSNATCRWCGCLHTAHGPGIEKSCDDDAALQHQARSFATQRRGRTCISDKAGGAAMRAALPRCCVSAPASQSSRQLRWTDCATPRPAHDVGMQRTWRNGNAVAQQHAPPLLRYSTGLRSTARHGTARRSTARHGTARQGTAQHGAAPHGTAWHGTA
jgi:hypothetical protein